MVRHITTVTSGSAERINPEDDDGYGLRPLDKTAVGDALYN
jgi:hypothetical protein